MEQEGCSTPIQVKHEAELRTIREKVDLLLLAVCGNGKEGLTIRVDRLEQQTVSLQSIDAKLDKMHEGYLLQPAICEKQITKVVEKKVGGLRTLVLWLVGAFIVLPSAALAAVQLVALVKAIVGGP